MVLISECLFDIRTRTYLPDVSISLLGQKQTPGDCRVALQADIQFNDEQAPPRIPST